MLEKNKYVNRSKISEAKFRELIRYFAVDLDASQIAQLSGVSRDTVNQYLKAIWGVAKTRLAKFRRMSKNTFYLHLKECEFRYNYRGQNLYLVILKIVRNNPLF